MNVTSAPVAGVISAPSTIASASESLLNFLRGLLGTTSRSHIAIKGSSHGWIGGRFSTARQHALQALGSAAMTAIRPSSRHPRQLLDTTGCLDRSGGHRALVPDARH